MSGIEKAAELAAHSKNGRLQREAPHAPLSGEVESAKNARMTLLNEFYSNGIDWVATGNFLAGVGTLGLAVVAFFTFRQWAFRESYSKDRERAIQILAIVNEAQGTFDSIRWPGFSLSEGFSAMQKLRIRDENDDIETEQWKNLSLFQLRQIYGQVHTDRIQQHTEYWERVYNLLGTAEAVFGENVRNCLFRIIRLRADIISSAHIYAKMNPEFDNDNHFPRHFEEKMWKGWKSDGPDPIDAELCAAKEEMRTALARYMPNRR